MNPTEKLTWLHKEVDDLVDRYQRESTRYKKDAFRLRLISVLLAAVISVLLGIQFDNIAVRKACTNIALSISAVISVLGAYEAFFDPRALWIRETVTFVRLKDLQRDLRFWATGLDPKAIDPVALEDFKRRLDSILQDTLKHWMKLKGASDIEKELDAKAELKRKAD
jgi:hypothetical protein